jgi:hypothetical protein
VCVLRGGGGGGGDAFAARGEMDFSLLGLHALGLLALWAAGYDGSWPHKAAGVSVSPRIGATTGMTRALVLWLPRDQHPPSVCWGSMVPALW